MTDSAEIEPGDVFVDQGGSTFTVEEVSDGEVHFENFYDHWVEEIAGFVEDGIWKRKD